MISRTDKTVAPRNIVIFSDGTGQRGGVYFDEARTNIYKLYRAARCGPDSSIAPERQLAFYDPGLGTRPTGAGVLTSFGRMIYNYVSQATGLGITRNIIACYATIIQLWRPGDRIFLFGFSRGAYTVRCLAAALCYSGIPTQNGNGKPLKRDQASARKLATRAVKTVYQHVCSPRDKQFQEQRMALAGQFRSEHACSENQYAFPFFIGVFDTVAALSDPASLAVLSGVYLALLAAVSLVLGSITETTAYWAAWIGLNTVCVLVAAYVYTHLKFSFRLPGYRWWETVHLTTFRQRFYDQDLDDRIGYARHAISIDERRADFKRVRWGNPRTDIERPKIDRFQQIWFSGNHADIGGGYPENESRLSDIPLKWMIEAASDGLGDEGLLLDFSVLQPNPKADGMQHDETRNVAFRLAGKSDRDPVPDAKLHDTVVERFNIAGGVLQYDVTAPYRPEALRGHHKFPGAYANIPLPRQTCAQRIKAACRPAQRDQHPNPELQDGTFAPLEKNVMDRIVSCIALALLALAFAAGTTIFGYQCLAWLQSGNWPPMPLDLALGGIRSMGSDWIGLQRIYAWILTLPLVIALYAAGIVTFWIGGLLSATLYKKAADAQVSTIWISYLLFGLYLLVAAGTTNHRQLLLQDSFKLPALGTDVPLVWFFALSPIIFVLLHFYVLIQVLLLSRTAAAYNSAVNRTAILANENAFVRERLANTIFSQLLYGSPRERNGWLGSLLKLISWVTLVAVPLYIVLSFQIVFLPYHSHLATWIHRLLIVVELSAALVLWPLVLDTRKDLSWTRFWRQLKRYFILPRKLMITIPSKRGRLYMACRHAGLILVSVAILSFSILLVSFPGEPHTNILAFNPPTAVRCDRWISQNLDHLAGPFVNIIDQDKFKRKQEAVRTAGDKPWKGESTREFRNRDFACAPFDFADLSGVNFEGARMDGAHLLAATLQDADLNNATLQMADLTSAHLNGANLSFAHLRGAKLFQSDLRNASLFNAGLQGADLSLAMLKGADLGSGHLEGVNLIQVQLEGATMTGASLEGASLQGATYRGGDLSGAHLMGADLSDAKLDGVDFTRADLSGAFLRDPSLQGVELKEAILNQTVFVRPLFWRALHARCENAVISAPHFDAVIGLQMAAQATAPDGGNAETELRNLKAFVEQISDNDAKARLRRALMEPLVKVHPRK
jgi:uncharacterized protein YjbI with pentapeptide repeats/uncharacterized protein (DUF2235 family)